VLSYENNRRELLSASNDDLSKRLYKLTGCGINRVQQYEYGKMTFVHHQEARPSSDIITCSGRWLSSNPIFPKIELNHNQLFAMIEGVDFSINTTGHIIFSNND